MAANFAVSNGWSFALVIPAALFDREASDRGRVHSYPSGPVVLGELVRIDFDQDYLLPHASALKANVLSEVGPFIIGVGEVEVRETPKGLVIVLMDDWVES